MIKSALEECMPNYVAWLNGEYDGDPDAHDSRDLYKQTRTVVFEFSAKNDSQAKKKAEKELVNEMEVGWPSAKVVKIFEVSRTLS